MNTNMIVFGKGERAATVIITILLLVIAWLNWQIAILAAIVVLAVYLYNCKSIRQQREEMKTYLDTMTQNVNQASNFALQNLPTAIVIVDKKARVCWSNSVFHDWMQPDPDKTYRLGGFMPNLRMDKIWGKSGFFNDEILGRYYRVIYKYIETKAGKENLAEEDKNTGDYMAFYFTDITESEKVRKEAEAALPVFCFLQIDNLEDVTKGFGDVEYTNLWAEVNNVIVEEIDRHDGFIRNYADDAYIVCFSRSALDEMIEKNFPILDRVRSLPTSRRIPITISMGIATSESSMKEQAEKARSGLELALGRGGDQASVYIGSEVKFYGGKTQGAEKNTRVRARVVSQAVKELMNDADNVIVMGHEREDYDSIGGAIGVSVIAKADGKSVHIAVSDQTLAIQKLRDLFPLNPDFKDLLISPQEAEALTTPNTLVFVVDVHRPDMVAAPKALQKSNKRVVIDHHRRSSDFIEKPLLVYLEPASSSTSELVTELIQYHGENIALTPLEASALYAGIVVDTKNFVVQTGSRTFDAASFLRRSGADLNIVRHLFMDSFDSMQLRAKMMAESEIHGNMAFTECPKGVTNAPIMSAQAADILVSIEDIEASFVLYYLPDGGIGVSARSQGNINVQLIMEALGGGGHRTVAGAQLRDMDMMTARAAVLQAAEKAEAAMREEEKE